MARGGGIAPDFSHICWCQSPMGTAWQNSCIGQGGTRPHLRSICSLPSKLKEVRMKTFHTMEQTNKHSDNRSIFQETRVRRATRSGACSSLCSGSPVPHVVHPGTGLGSFRVGVGATVQQEFLPTPSTPKAPPDGCAVREHLKPPSPWASARSLSRAGKGSNSLGPLGVSRQKTARTSRR